MRRPITFLAAATLALVTANALAQDKSTDAPQAAPAAPATPAEPAKAQAEKGPQTQSPDGKKKRSKKHKQKRRTAEPKGEPTGETK